MLQHGGAASGLGQGKLGPGAANRGPGPGNLGNRGAGSADRMGAGNLKQGGRVVGPRKAALTGSRQAKPDRAVIRSVIGLWEAEASATAALSEICIKAATAPA